MQQDLSVAGILGDQCKVVCEQDGNEASPLMEEGDVALGGVNGVGSLEEDFLAVDEDRAKIDTEALRLSE